MTMTTSTPFLPSNLAPAAGAASSPRTSPSPPFKKLGREFHPLRENLHLSDEQKANTTRKVAVDASTLLGRKVVSVDRTDGAKFVFEDGSWILVRLSGTEPIVRLYVEAESAAATEKLKRVASDWILTG